MNTLLLITIMFVVQHASPMYIEQQELERQINLAKCYSSKIAVFLTYISMLTDTRNLATQYCQKRIVAISAGRQFI